MADRIKPKLLQAKVVARSRLFCIEQLDLRFSNGTEVQYERMTGSQRGAVLVVPVLNNDMLLLVREYAAGSDCYELCFPKGRIEEGETAEQSADRELQEEVGYAAGHTRYLQSVSTSPGYSTHRTHLVLATELYPQRAQGDEPEALEVVTWPLARAKDLLQQADFTEARSLAALLLLLDGLGRVQ
ncbi:MAG TPA: ADP compounds hydrolase NudE [Gammaproteobacteria bacterium]|nr:ADP compounds hydrolase NudE [Gammaproteobacteria bacterium]